MKTKKSLCFLVGLFVILVWIWGFAAPALSETLKCKSEAKVREQNSDMVTEEHYVGATIREGSLTCDNGETATLRSYGTWDVIFKKEGFSQTYTVLTFNDNSKILTKFQGRQIPDPEGKADWIWSGMTGTSEILKGTNRFKGIKGSVSFEGKQLPSKISTSEWTFTYTLPPK